MEKSIVLRCRSPLWFVISTAFVFWCFLFYFNSSALRSSGNEYLYAFLFRGSKLLLVADNNHVEPVNQPFLMDDRVQPVVQLPGTVDLSEHSREDEPVKEPSIAQESTGIQAVSRVTIIENVEAKSSSNVSSAEDRVDQPGDKADSDTCSGRYIYVYDLPGRFNADILRDCLSLNLWTDMCKYLANFGLGPQLADSGRVFSSTSWYATDQFSLDVIFNSRMKQYECLTNDSSLASAIFVPFYAGLDVGRYLWRYNTSVRDSTSLALMKWLAERPEWKVLGGRDHFLLAGRTTWDFRRMTEEDSGWGNKLMFLPEAKNMTMLVIESSPLHRNDFAIPYPTFFHPKRDDEVFQWQNRMRRVKRRHLFSFVGAPRPSLSGSIRGKIIDQCLSSKGKCRLLNCDAGWKSCHSPSSVMKMFQNSVFCLQPPGDSYSRKSAFDSMLAGCIPVFFHPGSAYVQYLWHLPKDYTKYSVFISENDVKEGRVSIREKLLQIPNEEVRAKREEVIRLIPRLIYADSRSRLKTTEDAFDLTIKGVIDRVDRIRKEISDGVNSDIDYPEVYTWKYNLFGTVEKHDWDPFFPS
ncbi:PREDICTED: xyloglucan galactosyltransferase MUR3-like [Nelumbo nucifera]|uniref:Xyloglucan galactosyltransferase MUR3-like n=1 Tax=Nelumbo nucifera TaxID=4432 RepID=A0A1U8AJS5_NELNU|nr:PREDICTED: xyloglucan galactosyltransferase MUR3-like [Nelumbo nucifera]